MVRTYTSLYNLVRMPNTTQTQNTRNQPSHKQFNRSILWSINGSYGLVRLEMGFGILWFQRDFLFHNARSQRTLLRRENVIIFLSLPLKTTFCSIYFIKKLEVTTK